MMETLITLTTDFGEMSPYVAAMKGAILSVHPAARLLDLSHQIPPQDLATASWFLEQSVPYFPPDTIHVVVVDPGVGTERRLLRVETHQQQLLVPDNGCWTALAALDPRPLRVQELSQPAFWRPRISSTFHGRDILAPVAAWLARGLCAESLGPQISSWSVLAVPELQSSPTQALGEVLAVDGFGNLISNISARALEPLKDQRLSVWVAKRCITRQVRSYAEAPVGSLVFLWNSSGYLEIALVEGSASQALGIGRGGLVRVEPAATDS